MVFVDLLVRIGFAILNFIPYLTLSYLQRGKKSRHFDCIYYNAFVTAFAALLATANSYDAAAAIKLAIGIYHSDFANTIIGDCDFGADLKGCNKDISCR